MAGAVRRLAGASLFVCLNALVMAAPPAAAQGFLVLNAPPANQTFDAGDQFAVLGRAVDFNGTPIGGVRVDVRILNSFGSPVPGVAAFDTTGTNDGSFFVSLPPGDAPARAVHRAGGRG